MEIEAPTFSALNKPQRRAFILRDQLRFVDSQHLNEFLDGVSNDEPPTYTKVNGAIKPPLTLVTLKEEAKRFDLGNVYLPEENNNVHHVYLVVEDGHIQMRAEDPLPQDEDILDSCPIHGFIARGIVPLFKEKFQLIHARMNRINESRRAAYNMPNEAPALFHEGETLLRLCSNAEQNHVSSIPKKGKKRERSEEVVPHVSNKRKHVGLDVIPEEAKRRTFDTIPSHVKIELFNSIAKTAFPNFDNLMTAAWNVVSIYSACGSEFRDLHSAIVVLKDVLRDFDEAFGRRGDRTTPSYRYDFGGSSRFGSSGCHDQIMREIRLLPSVPTSAGSQSWANQPVVQAPVKPQDERESLAETPRRVEQEQEQEADQEVNHEAKQEAEREDQPTPVLELAEPHQVQIEDDDNDSGDDEIPPVNPRLGRRMTNDEDFDQSSPQHMSGNLMGGSPPCSAHSPSEIEYTQMQREFVKKVNEKAKDVGKSSHGTTISRPTSPDHVYHREGNVSIVGKVSTPPHLEDTVAFRPSLTGQEDIKVEYGQHAPPLLQHQYIPTRVATSAALSMSPPTPTKQKKTRQLTEFSVEVLEEKIQERTERLINAFGSMDNVPAQSRVPIYQLEAAKKQRLQLEPGKDYSEENSKAAEMRRTSVSTNHGMFGKYLGNSLLGAKKSSGIAPVAPMFPNGSLGNPSDVMDRGGSGRPSNTPPNGWIRPE